MKRILMLAVVAFISLSVCAQEKYDPRTNGNIIFKAVNPRWNLKDKIKIRNRSTYLILQVVVAEVVGHELRPLGSCSEIDPGEVCDIASFDKNTLKYLKGKTIAIKAKGLKRIVGEQSRTDVRTPFGDVNVKHKSVDQESANEINPEDITYEFDTELFESSHDLLIELYSTNGNSVMDF